MSEELFGHDLGQQKCLLIRQHLNLRQKLVNKLAQLCYIHNNCP